MKTIKTISALALVLGLAQASHAQTSIYISGSTAFRAQVFAGVSADMGLTVDQGSGSANSFTLHGTVSDPKGLGFSTGSSGIVGKSVNVFCTFSGSAEGVDALINPGSATFDQLTSLGGGTFTHTGVDLAFTDVGQGSTPDANSSDQLTEIQLNADASRLPFTGIAVQPFGFFGNSNAFTTLGIKNITSQNFHDLYNGAGNGQLGANFFTGGTGVSPVVAVGRYNLSGTRIATIEDTGFGAPTPALLSQYALSADGTTTPGVASTDANPVPANATQWLLLSARTNGYFTGGNVGTALQISTANSLPAAIGYLGFPDAGSKLTDTTHNGALTFNGQTPGTFGAWNITGVENGGYSFWSYERLYTTDAHANANDIVVTFGTALVQAIQHEISTASPRTAVLESEMNVYRANDGSDIVHY